MGRPRLHVSDAERQKAFRERRLVSAQLTVAVTPPAKRKRAPSRPARLAQIIRDVQGLAVEYENWLTSLPETLQDTDVADRLGETVEQLNAAADLLIELELPKGFGRD